MYTSDGGKRASPRPAATAAHDDRHIADHNVMQSITQHIYPTRRSCAQPATAAASLVPVKEDVEFPFPRNGCVQFGIGIEDVVHGDALERRHSAERF